MQGGLEEAGESAESSRWKGVMLGRAEGGGVTQEGGERRGESCR
jgi:hypothetical protein